MEQQSAATLEVADALARLYIDELAREEGVPMRSMMWGDRDAIADIVGDLEDGTGEADAPVLRVDLIVATVLVARMIAGEPGLAKRLRQDAPVIAVACHTAQLTQLVADVVRKCAVRQDSRALIVSRDGTHKDDNPDKGNDDVVRALSCHWPLIGVAVDPRRHLPRTLMRTTEHLLSVPSTDAWTIRLVLEAVTQTRYDGPVDDMLLRQADFTDFSISFRRGLSPAECLDRLATMIRSKKGFLGDGPSLEDTDGYGAAKVWGLELAADMIEYRAGRLRWDEVDHKGLLISGPPGVGKTSFAKALARSAGLPLVATSVAQWNASSHLGETLRAIRDVFGEAKRSAPSILFIDELDGISDRSRLQGAHVAYWSQIVNLLLECLAGIEDREGVIVLGATNHPDMIDAAVLRAGRLDHHIALEKPTVADLSKILRFHLGNKLLAGADMMEAALAGRGGSGADAEAWVRRAKARARRERRDLTMDDILDQIRGAAPSMPADVRRRIAMHEAGHVVVGRALEVGELLGVSILDSGGLTELAGPTTSADTEDAIDNGIAFLLAGRAAEEVIFKSPALGSGGPGNNNDLARATKLAAMAEVHHGYGEMLGLVHLGGDEMEALRDNPVVLEGVKVRLHRAFEVARQTLTRRVDEVVTIGDALAERGYLSASDVDTILSDHRGAKPISPDTPPRRRRSTH